MKRELWSVLGNSQRLDGGAMFGNAPKAFWTRFFTPDEENRIALACRCLLVRERRDDGSERRILLETGIGAFFEPEMRKRFGVVEDEHVLLASLEAAGFDAASIDVVVLSHLHFDHAGGLLSAWSADRAPELVFENASFVVGRKAWERATHPHPRDRASFIPELPGLLESSGRLEIVEGETSTTLGPEWRFHLSDGHTPGMLLTRVEGANGPIVFAADLIPGRPWVRRAITMGYDRFPELLIDEKTALLNELVDENGRLFFTHDPDCAMTGLSRDDRGHIVTSGEVATLTGQIA